MRRERKVPRLNSSAMADISFILLTFFLVATSMGSEEGLARRLPPPIDENEQQPTDIKERNLLHVGINSDGTISCNGTVVTEKELLERIKTFVSNPHNDATLPEKKEVDIPLLGKKCVTTVNHLISIETSRVASYETYFHVQDIIVRAYSELRNELAKRKFGISYKACSNEQQEAIRQFYPQKISEGEQNGMKGGAL